MASGVAPYRTFPYKGFGGGLNLRDGPDVLAEDQAIDLMNVMFTTRGSVASRSGYAKFTPSPAAETYDSLAAFYKADGTKQIIAGHEGNLDAIDTSGEVIASTTAPTLGPHYFQRFGGPAGEYLFISNGSDTVRRWDGATFDTPVYTGVTPNGKFLGLSVTDNRLVNAGFSGAVEGNNPSTVRFSQEGDPLTFETQNRVDLTPGDGEEIMGVVTWRDQIFVFKNSKFFVFYGTSITDDGDPEFLYRPIDAGVGLAAPLGVAVAEQGVYFLDRTGIYFTNGTQPQRVSDLVEPIFHGGSSVYYTGGELNDGAIEGCSMVYHDERLWLSYPSGSSDVNDRQLIFDPFEKWFTLADLPMGAAINFRPGDVEEIVFGYTTDDFRLGRYVDGSYTADNVGQIKLNQIDNPKAGAGTTTNWLNTNLVSFNAVDLDGVGGPLPDAEMIAAGIDTAFRCVGNADNDRMQQQTLVVELGKVYHYSYWAYIVSSTATGIRGRIDNGSGQNKLLIATFNTTGVWTRFDGSFVADEDASNWRAIVRQQGAGDIDYLVTGLLVEEADELSDYYDGDSLHGTWLGTPEESESTIYVAGAGGEAINSFWQGGWFNYSTPLVKTIREAKISGMGLVDVIYYRDYRQTPSQTQQKELSPPVGLYDTGLEYDTPGLNYGPSGFVAAKSLRKAIRGEVFSIKFACSTIHRAFKVHRLTTHIREARIPSVVKVK